MQPFAEALSDINITIKLSFSFYVIGSTSNGTVSSQIVLYIQRADGTLEQKMRAQHIAGNFPTFVNENITSVLHKGDTVRMELELNNSVRPVAMTWTTYLRGFSLSVIPYQSCQYRCPSFDHCCRKAP